MAKIRRPNIPDNKMPVVYQSGGPLAKQSKDISIFKKAPKKMLPLIGRLMGYGMAAWMAYEILSYVGLTGAKGEADKGTMAAIDAMGSQWAQREQAGGQNLEVRKGMEDMQNYAGFAQAKQTGTRDMGKAVSRELDSLLGGKASLLSKASLAQPGTQKALHGLGEFI